MNELIETKEADNKAAVSLEFARGLTIKDDIECRTAIEYEQGLSALIKWFDEIYDKPIKEAFAHHRGLVADKRAHVEPVEEAKRLIKGKRIVYTEEQERIRKAEEAKIQAEARRLAEEAALAAAIAAEEAGEGAEAEAIISEPVHVPVITVAKTVPSAGVAGAIKEIWWAEVVDIKELLMAIVHNQASIGLIEPNMVALNGMARSLKKAMIIPGVVAKSRKV